MKKRKSQEKMNSLSQRVNRVKDSIESKETIESTKKIHQKKSESKGIGNVFSLVISSKENNLKG